MDKENFGLVLGRSIIKTESFPKGGVMPELIYVCPSCNIRVWPMEKGVVQKGRHLYHEACDKKTTKIGMFDRFFARGSPMIIFPKRPRR